MLCFLLGYLLVCVGWSITYGIHNFGFAAVFLSYHGLYQELALHTLTFIRFQKEKFRES